MNHYLTKTSPDLTLEQQLSKNLPSPEFASGATTNLGKRVEARTNTLLVKEAVERRALVAAAAVKIKQSAEAIQASENRMELAPVIHAANMAKAEADVEAAKEKLAEWSALSSKEREEMARNKALVRVMEAKLAKQEMEDKLRAARRPKR